MSILLADYPHDGMLNLISISFEVDAHLRDVLSCYVWKVMVHPKTQLLYARRWNKRRRRWISLHREVYEHLHGPIPINTDIDHIDRNPQNNLGTNLRAATRSQNNANHKRRCDSQSKYKGVMLRKNGTWTARICVNKKRINLGTFNAETLAALAYDDAAVHHYGEFAKLNFSETEEE